MRAVGYRRSLPIENPESLQDLDLPAPVPQGRDLLVRVRAVSVNPVDYKVRLRADPGGEPKVLGWDAAGVVEAVGPGATLFRPGDEVFYAGDITRAGTNAELHLVDERIVGAKPRSLGFAEAAALPLTSLTAWEMLFDRLEVRTARPDGSNALLIIGGAGGVGSVAIQLARRLTGLRVIATASRVETRDWALSLGAHDVVDHAGDLPAALRGIGLPEVSFVFSTTHSDRHWAAIAEVVAPQGRVGLIDDPEPVDVRLLKRKSASLHWELMFTRSSFATPDLDAQHRILSEVSRLVDEGTIRTTVAERFGAINAANLRRAHALLESGRSRGKIVLEGFGD
ncbi:zinc-binding alcohol dehydrogenase family protein [Roseomonas sp. CCTCC AB2023176]|uniref:zinc-binding alcohol dehydrogenase family protein n=1 Tax=Roseomonas sp. CCTCC AB2023176 TaxID=3342640 RepID=UPI0035DDC708